MRKIPFACYYQTTADTCLATCVKMVLAYYGTTIGEQSFYKQARFKDYHGLCDAAIAMPLIKKGFTVTSYWNGNLADWGVWTPELQAIYRAHELAAKKTGKYHRKKNATLKTIKNYLDKNIPVIAEVFAGKFYHSHAVGTHMIVIIHYDNKGFYCCDPWGAQHFVKYERFMKAWRHNGIGRSMIIIQPTWSS